jgi:hypothetical protein
MRKGFDNFTFLQEVPPGLNRLGKAEVGDLCAFMRLFEGNTEARNQTCHVMMPSYTEI